ncbi:MAG: CBS domain-containing protein [Candidatus Jordarchaeum sp.]|uniref:CBS domain-containing protein n=1 Tax=Candidatus Jordarchaeum sp. TaxID=2823881 RepID=UPI004049D92A
MKVQDIMEEKIPYVTVPGTRDDALHVMRESGKSFLPVVKKGSKEVVGTISERNFMEKPEESQIALLMRRDPITVSKETPIKELVKILLENNLRHVPVTKDGKELVGLVSVSDVVRKAIAMEKESGPIKDYVKKELITVWEATPVPVAFKIMNLSRVNLLPVLDDNSNLSGIIDYSDFVHLSEVVSEEKVSSISASSEGTDWSWDSGDVFHITTKILRLPNKPIKEVMTKNVETVSELTSFDDCAKKMRKFDLSQLPVTDAKGNLSGLIRDVDLIRGFFKI